MTALDRVQIRRDHHAALVALVSLREMIRFALAGGYESYARENGYEPVPDHIAAALSRAVEHVGALDRELSRMQAIVAQEGTP